MKLQEYPDQDILMVDLATTLAGELAQALMGSEHVTLAVPGGTTPGPVFDALCAADLDWARVTVLAGDERCVPPESARSNARLIRGRLLTGRAAAANFLPLYAAGRSPAQAAAAASRAVEPLLPISVLLLGMGADMHTASLFPGADRLSEALSPDAPPVIDLQAPGAAEPRVTLTGPVLSGALKTHLLITGPEKRAALETAERLNDPLAAPVALVLPQATVHWAE